MTSGDLSRLVDRDPELAGIAAALETARTGVGSVVVIAGAAGTGKSALLAVAVERARAQGTAVRSGRGSELEQELSFGVIQQLFEVPVRSAPAAERERLLSGAATAAAGLFADAPIDHATRADGGFATLHGLYWLAAGIAGGHPLVLTVDDAHWADEPTLRALSFLAGRIADVPIVLVITLRSHEPSGAADVLAGLESDPNASPDGAPGARSRGCGRDRAGGDPGGRRRAVPGRLRGHRWKPVVRARAVAQRHCGRRWDAFDRRGPGGRGGTGWRTRDAAGRRARSACTAVGGGDGGPGRERPVARRGRGCRAERGRGGRSGSAMRRVEILGVEDPFEWTHPIVQRSIYDALTVTERDALHARAAEVFACAGASRGVVAAHLSALRPAGSTGVVTGLLAAVDEALTRDAPDVAVALLRRALDEGADEPLRATLLLELGQVEVTRRDPAATAVLEEARGVNRFSRRRSPPSRSRRATPSRVAGTRRRTSWNKGWSLPTTWSPSWSSSSSSRIAWRARSTPPS